MFMADAVQSLEIISLARMCQKVLHIDTQLDLESCESCFSYVGVYLNVLKYLTDCARIFSHILGEYQADEQVRASCSQRKGTLSYVSTRHQLSSLSFHFKHRMSHTLISKGPWILFWKF